MLEHLKRLQDQLAQTTLSPQAVRDGLLSAYLVVSRFNQAEGDPQVGLKQGTPALADYLSGFMSAVFTERGFSFDQPTLDQLSELKMMADGVVQLYAMPEDLQSFLNELYDQLMARGHGIPSRVSAAVLERLDHRVPEPGPATETLEPSPPAETQAPEVPSADAFKGIWDIGDLPPSPDLASGAADPDGLTGEQRPSSALGDEVAFEDLPLPDAPKVRASRRAEPDLADADVISEAEVVGETPIKTATRKKKASVKKAAKKKAGVKAAPRRRRVQPQALKISLSSLTAEAAREKAEAFTLPVGEPTPAGPEAVAARSLEPELASPDRPLPGDAENLDALLEAVEGKAIPLSQPEKMPAFDPSAFAAEPGSSETPAPSTEAFDPSAFDAELGSSETPAPTTQAFDPSVFAAELEGARSPEPTPAEPAPASEVFDPAALAAELESIEIKPKPEERLSFDTFEPVTPEPRSSGSSSDETAAISQPHPRAEEWNPLPLETLSNPSASTAEEPRLGPEAQEEPGETEPPAKPAVEETPWWAVPPAIVDPRDPAPSVEQTSSEPMPGFDDLLSKMSEPAERSGTALSPEITVDTETGERAQTLDDILASFDSKTPAAADQETSVEVEAPDLLSAMTAEPEPVVEPRPEPFQPITRPEPSRPPSMIADDAFRAPGQDDAFTMGPDVKEDLLGTGTVIFAPSAKPAEATLTSSTKAAPKPSEPAAEVDTMPSE